MTERHRSEDFVAFLDHVAEGLEADVDVHVILDNVSLHKSATVMDADETVRSDKRLASVERAFRSLNPMDLKVRPVYHRRTRRVRAHVLLCMLAYYVEWYMRAAWQSLLFHDDGTPTRPSVVAPATPSS